MIERGREAAALLAHPVFVKTTARLLERYQAYVMNSDPADSKTREQYFAMHYALQMVMADLTVTVAEGIEAEEATASDEAAGEEFTEI